MPTYDGIGETITHKLEIEGDLFLQDIEGGTNSTQVPLEIFSNFQNAAETITANSRMLRLRVQNAAEANVSNSYVTDMGIRGEPDKDYFFITAPQNTSNVGDQNTFVISKTSNVGIGTTDPGHYRLLVNNSSTKQFGVPGNDTPTTGDTLIYNESGEWVYSFPAGNLPAGSINNEILTWNGANWIPNHSMRTTNSNTSIGIGVGIGTFVPGANLHVIGSVTATSDVDISGKFQGGKLRVGSLLSAVPTNPNVTVPGDLTVSGTLTSDEWIHTSNLDITGNINVDYDVLIDGTYQGTGMRLDGTLQNLRGAIPDLSVAGSITATGDIKTDQTFRGTDMVLSGTASVGTLTHGTKINMLSDVLMGPATTLTASNIVGGSPLTITSDQNLQVNSDLTVGNSNLFVDNVNGRVGIGTDSPLEKLDVYGTGRISAAYPRLDFYTTTGRSTTAWGDSTGAAGDYRIYSNGDASDGTKRSLNFDYGQNSVHTSRMVINADGNVGIGTTSPQGVIHVYTYGRQIFGGLASSSSTYGWYARWNERDPGYGKTEFINQRGLGGGGFEFGTNFDSGLGSFGSWCPLYALSFNSQSDFRLKRDIQTIENGLDTVSRLNPTTFEINISTDGIEYVPKSGFIAQEVYYDTPELRHSLTIPRDAEPDIETNRLPNYENWGNGKASMDTSSIIPYLVKAIQELKARIEALENSS